MMTIDKKIKEVDWTQTHTLSKEQLQKLLDDKLKRAYHMHQLLNKREMSVQRHR
jgi:DNA-binding Xre family transcriptional regulator